MSGPDARIAELERRMDAAEANFDERLVALERPKMKEINLMVALRDDLAKRALEARISALEAKAAGAGADDSKVHRALMDSITAHGRHLGKLERTVNEHGRRLTDIECALEMPPDKVQLLPQSPAAERAARYVVLSRALNAWSIKDTHANKVFLWNDMDDLCAALNAPRSAP